MSLGKFVVTFVLLAFVTTLRAQISSDFVANADGWTAPNANTPGLVYTATGGNPGGQISASPISIVLGATTIYGYYYFVAPAKFLGNRSAYYDGTLRFDLQQQTTNTSTQHAEVAILNNAGIGLYYYPTTPFQPPAAPAWQTFSVNLGATSGFWKTTDSPAGTAATAAQITAILSDLATLQILGLHRDANVTTRMDNVTMMPPIIINTQPVNSSICFGNTTTFTTAASNNPAITYQWQFEFSPSVWTNITNTGGYSNVATATLTVNTSGNFGVGNYRCRISGTAADDVFTAVASLSLISLPPPPTTTGAASCSSAALTLTAAGGTNGQYRWYPTSSGGSAIAGQTTSSFTTPVLSATTTYFAAINNGTCESPRTGATATIVTPPAPPTATGNSGCTNANVTLSASGGTGGQYRWYTVAGGGTAIAGETNSTYATPALTTTTAFYVSINNGTCESTRTTVTATINPIPAAPTTTGGSSCATASVTLTASGGTNGQYRWYSVATGGSAIAGQVNSTFATPVLSSTTSYFVSVNNGSCESARTAVVATIGGTCSNLPPVIQTSPSKTQIGGTIELDLEDLISDVDNNLDPATLKVITPPPSGAKVSFNNFILIVDYTGITFTGKENITISVCDVFAACSQQTFSIEVLGAIKIFNALSPGRDGKNDVFYIENIEKLADTRKNHVTIYNRWGDLVWEGTDYNNASVSFVGKSKNNGELPSGTYFYKIEFSSGRKMETGYILLKQ